MERPTNIRDLLELWGFPDRVEIFEKEEIDLATLPMLGDAQLLTLFPKMGPRLKFSNMLQTYLKGLKQASTSNDEESPNQERSKENLQNSEQPPPPGTKRSGEEIDLESLLNDPSMLIVSQLEEPIIPGTHSSIEVAGPSTPTSTVQEVPKKRSYNEVEGNSVFEYIKKSPDGDALLKNYLKNSFTTSDRKNLVELVIKAEMRDSCETKITPDRFAVLAKEICEVFPEEKPGTYYIPGRTGEGGQHVAPKGKLYHRYLTVIRFYRERGARSGSRKKPTAHHVAEPEIDEENDGKVEADFRDLKKDKEPYSTIYTKWVTTFFKRRKIILQPALIPPTPAKKRRPSIQFPGDESHIKPYTATFPALQQATGILMLAKDFELLYSTVKSNILFLRWPEISLIIKSLQQIEDDLSDLELFKAFAGLFEPITIGPGKGWRPTKAEIIEGFIVHVKVIDDLESTVIRLREKATSVKKTIQPFPLVVDNGGDGANTLCYVVIDNIRYRVESVLSAVDLCFKSYFALHAQYPVQSEAPWLLLQRAIYDITTPWDKVYQRVEELLPHFKLPEST